MIMAVFLFPAGIFAGGIPDDLRIGTHEKIISPAFQLFSAGGIQHFIIFPLICDPHIFLSFLRTLFAHAEFVSSAHRHKSRD